MNGRTCEVQGCEEYPMTRLPFCPGHLYEHRVCDVLGCLEKLPLDKRRCADHHPFAPTKEEVVRERILGASHAAE